MAHDDRFVKLEAFLERVPAVQSGIATGYFENGLWWVKFALDVRHELAWRAVQEFAFVLNYLSTNERLPTKFFPVSPPPYLNGGPEDVLSWVVESADPQFAPDAAAEWLESRLPSPVDDPAQWRDDDDADE